MNISIKEIARFVLVGVMSVATDAFFYFLLLPFWGPTASKAGSFVCGSVVAFTLNKYWTFKNEDRVIHGLFRFIVLYSTTLLANSLANHLVLYVLPGYFKIGFLTATGVSTILNFIGLKFWVFKKYEQA